jgi:hypothetical protein
MTALGDFFKSIEKVQIDLDTFADFLERLRKDELTFERVKPRRWRVQRFGCPECWVIALPISENELIIDLYLMEWDQDPKPVAYEEDNGEVTIEWEPNIWPRMVFNVIQAGLQELGVLGEGEHAEDDMGKRRGGHPGLPREEVIYRLAKAQEAEEIKQRDPSMTWKEIAREIGWRYGASESGVKKLQYARDRLHRLEAGEPDKLLLRHGDPDYLLARIAQYRETERKKT